MEQNNKAGRKKKIAHKFLTTFFITIGIFLAAFVVVIAGLNYFGTETTIDENGEKVTTKKGGGFFDLLTTKKEKVYGLLVGTDDGKTHTDIMILGCFDPETEEINLVSLPRDTMVTIPQDRVKKLIDIGSPIHESGVVKLTEVYHFAYVADKTIAMDYLRNQVKDLLDVDVDFYVNVDLDAFEYIVDEIGGVEFDVPERMYYNDPTQNLLINLQPGVQLLDGKDAEGLVRFRNYANGADILRMQVQQSFIKAFITQAVSKDNFIKNAPTMITAALKYVDTDFDMTTLPSYLKYLDTFKTENIHTYTLPMVGNTSYNGKAMVELDVEGSKELLDEIFYGKKVEAESAIGKRIQVLNGGGEAGLAKKGQDFIEGKGFTVTSIGDYSGVKSDNTRIFVSKRSYGNDLKTFISGSDIVYDPSLDSNYDIVVVIGRNGIE